ncbi:uncharacterized protein RAG0_06959 [Rhynchosporium agropyri]|uniref:Uncharacterized protein n=1 Tax=Rhynchosporium agropyri TaxID=914238 RepID=A0A1E1KJB1_9HELO|nr:uncharacterized protein RAG0_06959 [Rhynchosporium agropyri]
MPELVSLEITNSKEEVAFSSESKDALGLVVKRGRLRHLVILASRQAGFPVLKAPFTNLHTLSLHHIPRKDPMGRDGLSNVLIASPHMKHLGLSNRDFKSTELYQISQGYSSKRDKSNLHLLKLETLDLGAGYQPSAIKDNISQRYSDYLATLTDLECLASLQLRNCNLDMDERQQVHVPLFYHAVNLRSIEVDTLSQDIDALLKSADEALFHGLGMINESTLTADWS